MGPAARRHLIPIPHGRECPPEAGPCAAVPPAHFLRARVSACIGALTAFLPVLNGSVANGAREGRAPGQMLKTRASPP